MKTYKLPRGFTEEYGIMQNSALDLAALVISVINALEESKEKMDGIAFDPVTFFQHESMANWLPNAHSVVREFQE